MNSQTWLSIGTVLVAIGVPFLTFRLATRLEHQKWLRERRLETYTAFFEVLLDFKNRPPEPQEKMPDKEWRKFAVPMAIMSNPELFDLVSKVTEEIDQENKDKVEELIDSILLAIRRDLGSYHSFVSPSKRGYKDIDLA
jgi:hypothetical protein